MLEAAGREAEAMSIEDDLLDHLIEISPFPPHPSFPPYPLFPPRASTPVPAPLYVLTDLTNINFRPSPLSFSPLPAADLVEVPTRSPTRRSRVAPHSFYGPYATAGRRVSHLLTDAADRRRVPRDVAPIHLDRTDYSLVHARRTLHLPEDDYRT